LSLLIVMATSVSTAYAQSTLGDTPADGKRDGVAAAKVAPIKGKRGAGLATGLLTVLPGTLIGASMIGPAPVPDDMAQMLRARAEAYRMGFLDGWNDETRKRKRRTFFEGAAIGMGGILLLLIIRGGP